MSEEQRILIVDDNDWYREILVRHLNQRGFVTGEAENGEIALDKVMSETWDLILLDVMMPVISGLDVLKKIRETWSVTELAVIMVSAKGDSDVIKESLALGANDYITKPIDFQIAFSRIKAQLRHKTAVEKVKQLSKDRLDDEKARVDAILNQTRLSIINFDSDGAVISFNPGALEMFSATPEAVAGKPIQIYIPALPHRGSLDPQEDSLAFDLQETRGRSQKGKELWLEVSVSELVLSQSRTWIAIVKDMTHEYEVKKQLVQSEERFRLAMAGSSDGIWDWNLDTQEVYFSSHWFEMLGEKKEDWAGTFETWFQLISERDREQTIAAILDYVGRRSAKFELEYAMRHKSGRLVPVLCRGFLQRDEKSGAPIRFVGTQVDLSKQKELQERLERANQSLEEQVQARTRELEGALELAESSNKSKSDFLSMMSHEIRTPLNAIIGMSQLALSSNLNERQNHYITQSHMAAISLLDLLDDILDFSKIESDKLELESIEFDLDGLLSKVAASTSYSAQAKGIEYLFDIDPLTSGTFLGDPTRLGQILINFVGNAIKFTEVGEVVVKTKFLEEIEDKYRIEMTVSDTGIGMTEEQQAKLFRPFIQADMSVTRLFGGTGLGLTISKRLLELMGGEPKVVSEVGQGTSFSFRLLLKLVRKKSLSESLPQALKKKQLRVLVVDQGEVSRQILRRIIEHIGFQVEECESGLRAFEECHIAGEKNEPFDIVIMNWKLPFLDGIETAKRFSQDPLLKNLKICMMVPTNQIEEFQAKKESLDLASLLAKPFNISSVWNALAESISGPQLVERSLGTRYLKEYSRLHGRRVLLVEDNKINQELALDFLKLVHMHVVVAEDGLEALKVLKEQQFDAILMDLHMPEMDGFTTTRAIRQELKLSTPVIAMTASVGSINREEAKKTGFNDFVAKPFKVDDLYATLQKWTKGSSSEQPAHTPSQVPSLDQVRGLDHFEGDEKRYKHYLKLVYESFQDFEKDFLNDIEGEQWEAAYFKTHTLKGLAGTIGATPLEDLARSLEKEMRSETRENWEIEFQNAVIELNKLLSTISELFESEG